jgi:hypothetical protein
MTAARSPGRAADEQGSDRQCDAGTSMVNERLIWSTQPDQSAPAAVSSPLYAIPPTKPSFLPSWMSAIRI